MKFDVLIVGARVAGSSCAKLLAQAGYRVLLLEKNSRVGEPCRCAGLVSHRIFDFFKNLPEELVLNKVEKALFLSGNSSLEVEARKKAYILDRVSLDKFLFEEATQAGAQARLEEKFLSLEKSVKSFS